MLTSVYTKPLVGEPYHRSIGLIKVVDRLNRSFSVGEIILERFDEQNFQYIIRPYWQAIDLLPRGLFHGIPGINMDRRSSLYYRVNMTPTFIAMRTPSENRENVRELMAAAGLDYYDRFEWLLRTETRCGDDNLIVVRKPSDNVRINGLRQSRQRYLHPGDIVEIDSLSDFQSNNSRLVVDMYQFLQSGVQIFIREETRFISESERSTMLYLLRNMLVIMDRNNRQTREEGIRLAKANGRYSGRRPIEINENLLKQVAYEFENNHITEQEAMIRLGINSRSTFYRKLRTIRN